MRVWYVAIAGLVLVTGTLVAREEWSDSVPNAESVRGVATSCQLCHTTSTGPELNLFGQQTRSHIKSGRPDWRTLAGLDADKDGATNGQELQDPAGQWMTGLPQPGTQARVSNPSLKHSTPASIANEVDTWAKIKDLFR